MNRKVVGTLVIGLALGANSAMAANYGTAGCGLGALVLKDEPGKIQILSATLNNLISPQTSAITSGTSNCFEDDVRAEAAMYVTVNEQALQNDIARGNGETLAGLGKILKCEDTDRLGSALQKNYNTIFPTSNVTGEDAAKSIESSIVRDGELAHSCKVFG